MEYKKIKKAVHHDSHRTAKTPMGVLNKKLIFPFASKKLPCV